MTTTTKAMPGDQGAPPQAPPPSVFEAYALYAEGKMNPEQRAIYEQGVASGQIPLPAGVRELKFGIAAPITKTEQAAVPKASPSAIRRYTAALGNDASVADRFTPEEMSYFEDQVRKGNIALPPGVSLRPMAAPGFLDRFVEQAKSAAEAAEGPVGAAIMGGGPVAAGAAVGAAMGAPFAGVGAIPGAALGAGTVALGDLAASIGNALGGKFTSPSEAIRALLEKAGVPRPETATEKVIQTVFEGAAGGLGMAKAAGTAASVLGQGSTAGRVAAKMAEAPTQQAIMGATGSLGSEAAGITAKEVGAGPGMEAAARLAGGLLGGAAGAGGARRTIGATVTPASQSAERAAQRASIEAGERAGIDVMTSDITPPGTFMQKMTQTVGERIPFVGTGGARKEQASQRVKAVKDMLSSLGAVDESEIDDQLVRVADDLAKTRGASLDVLLGQKNSVIEKASATGNLVDVDNTFNVIAQEVEKLKKIGGSSADAAANELQKYAMALPGKSLSEVEMTRKALGNYLKSQGLGDIKEAADVARGNIYSALREDMSKHIKETLGADDVKKWQNANQKLASMARELKKVFPQLRSALNQGVESTAALSSAINSANKGLVKKIYSGLSPQGKANFKSVIVSTVAKDSGGIESISPERFLTKVKAKAKQFDVALSREEMNTLKGLQRALKVTARAPQAALAPPTGVQAVPYVAGGFLVDLMGGSVKGAGAVVGAVSGLARVLESKPVRDLIVKMPTIKPGSKAEMEWAQNFLLAAKQAAGENQPPQGAE